LLVFFCCVERDERCSIARRSCSCSAGPRRAAADVRRALRLEPANADTWMQRPSCRRNYWNDPKGACKSAQTAHALAPFTASTLATMTEFCTAKAGTTG